MKLGPLNDKSFEAGRNKSLESTRQMREALLDLCLDEVKEGKPHVKIELFKTPSDKVLKFITVLERLQYCEIEFDDSVEDAELRTEMQEIVESVGGTMFVSKKDGDRICCFTI